MSIVHAIVSILAGIAAGSIVYFAIARSYGLERLAREEEKPRGDVKSKAAQAVARYLPQSASQRRTVEDRIRAAGSDMTADMYRARCLAFATIGLAIGLAASAALGQDAIHIMAAGLVALIVGAAWPWVRLSFMARGRRREVESKLPSALEMLSASAGAGLTIERALELVSVRMDGVISEEFGRCVQDVKAYGYTTSEALGRMDARCQVPAMTLFCASAAQAVDQGSAISDVLASQAKIARENHFQAIEEQANRIPTKMVIPLVVLILPGVIAIPLAPAVINIMKAISGV